MEFFYEFNIVGIVFTAVCGALIVSMLAAFIYMAVVKKPVTAGTRVFRAVDIILFIVVLLAWCVYVLVLFRIFGLAIINSGSDLVVDLDGTPLLILTGMGAIATTVKTVLATVLLGVSTLLIFVNLILSFARRRRISSFVITDEECEVGGYGRVAGELQVAETPAPEVKEEPASIPDAVLAEETEVEPSGEIVEEQEPVVNEDAEESLPASEPMLAEEVSEPVEEEVLSETSDNGALFEDPLDPGFTFDGNAEAQPEEEPIVAEEDTDVGSSPVVTETIGQEHAEDARPEYTIRKEEEPAEERIVKSEPERAEEPTPVVAEEKPAFVYEPQKASVSENYAQEDTQSVFDLLPEQGEAEAFYGFEEYSEFADTDRLGGQVSDKKFSSALQLPENYENKIHPSEYKHSPIGVPVAKRPPESKHENAKKDETKKEEVTKTEEKLAVQMPPLPVTRKLVITNRMNVVNMFNDYLNEKDKDERSKLASSIGKIIIK